MRNPNRIPIILRYWEDILRSKGLYEKVEAYWKLNPDQRLSQVFVNLGMKEYEKDYYLECAEFTRKHLYIAMNKLLLWNNEIIRDMDVEDIRAILKHVANNTIAISKNRLIAMIDTLYSRNSETI